MNIQLRILRFVTRSNWILLMIAAVAGGMATDIHFSIGMLAGGFLVTINFHFMYRSLKKSLVRTGRLSSAKSVFAKQYLRFVTSIVIIYLLISKNYVDPGGLLIGLSVVVMSIFMASLAELKKILSEEAA